MLNVLTRSASAIARLAPALALAATLAGAGPAAAQAPPPDAEWRTFATEHFRVTYQPGLEPLARKAAGVAERAYVILRQELGNPPSGRIDMVVTDHADYTNGFASYFPSSRIVVHARPPAGVPQLAFARDWIELVVVHELVHIFHLEESGVVGNAVRAVFGRVPMIWPVFPVSGSPTWNVEGLATYYESRLTGAGRVDGSFHDMITRTAALEGGIPGLDDVSAPHPAWPGGQRSYGYGSRLMQHIADRYGNEAHRAIIEATGASLRPTFLFFDHVSENAVGAPFDELYDDWRRQATADAHDSARRVNGLGLTATEPIAGDGPFAGAPRVSPDGRSLSFAAHDFRSLPATRVTDLATRRTRTIGERNQFGSYLGPAAWLPDGSGLITAQLEFQGPYRTFSDLWRLDLNGRERRLTRGLRLAQPDVAPEGRRVAATQSHNGGIRLVVHDLVSGDTRVLADAPPGDAFDAPRWSPDGSRIAAGRFAAGRVDIVLVDTATGRLQRITDDDALDLGPAWSPDGRWILWWSDRTGIPNILAARVDPLPATAAEAPAASAAPAAPAAAPTVRQVTRVLTGAFDPEVAPDGRTLYLSVYHRDGWGIEATPFDPASWPVAPEPALVYGAGLLEPVVAGDTAGQPASSYSPWPTVRPYYWIPDWRSISSPGGSLRFAGLTTSGVDLLRRHEWSLTAGVDLGTGRLRGRGSWTYRRLGAVELTGTARRRWSLLTSLAVPDGQEAIYRRTDELSLSAFLLRSRWRSSGWLRLGVELESLGTESHDMTAAELHSAGWELRRFDPTVGVFGGPGFASARRQPYSISAEDGVAGSFAVGRWWDTGTGTRAYDEAVGGLSGYLGFPAWGFADHVVAARVAGLIRAGDAAFTRSIGGVPTGAAPLLDVGPSGSFFHVRGYAPGARHGTRAWVASGEWRFPIHMRAAPAGIMGFSLTSLAGSVFADLGDAWCTDSQLGDSLHGCASAGSAPLASVGAELVIDFGVFHNAPAVARLGAAATREGGAPALYLAFGAAF